MLVPLARFIVSKVTFYRIIILNKLYNVKSRRRFLQLSSLGLLLASQGSTYIAASASNGNIIKPRGLKFGDTIGLICPASEIEAEYIESVQNFLLESGYKVKLGNHVYDRYGYLAGKDLDRAADINAMFADRSVDAILPVRGGWGLNRILDRLDYNLIRYNPKIVIGYSDITSLLLAIYARTGIITFHGPVGISNWNDFTLNYFEDIILQKKAVTLKNPIEMRVKTITPGRVRGKILGGNLTVITSTIGSGYLPSFDGAILFVEEVSEDIYKIDRMLTQLKLAGILDRLSGFIFAQCRDCGNPLDTDPSLTLNQLLDDIIKPLKIPAWYGAAIGHIPNKFTVPIGLDVEIDASLGQIRMLQPAVI